ncbi:MAG: FMN-binding negative transcriptional regulator [Saprospiraceae bacterium]|nr:FMN-binding negative transcriptional regulator [Saprospiraceae bacterium]
MYVARKNHAPSNNAVIEFVKKYSFATLISHVNDKMNAVHLPLEITQISESLILSGHVAKANPIANAIQKELNVLVIFSEPHAYISSSWYDHVNVPTWNYIAVHCQGEFKVISEKEVLDGLNKMVEHYESGRKDRYHISDMPDDMLQAHLNGLVGFEIKVEKSIANFKLSQNRNDLNYNNIIENLIHSDNQLEREIGQEMRSLRQSSNQHTS